VDVEVDLNVSYPMAGGGSTVGNATWQSHIKTFLDLIETGTGRKPIIYTNRNFWSFTMTKTATGMIPPSWTDQYYLWCAWYPFQPEDFNALPASEMPSGWTKWAMWQWEDGGRQNGYLANDLNIASDWYAAELGAIVIPPPVEPPPVPPATTHVVEVFIDGVSAFRKEL